MKPATVDALYPDETLASLFRRTALLGDLRKPREWSETVFGRPWRSPDEMLPTPLFQFYRTMGKYCAPIRTLLFGHTYYPYFLPVLNEHKRSAFLRRLIYGSTGPVSPCRQPLSLWPMPPITRVCPLCDADMKEHYGISFTKRIHVGPFVTRCPVHGTFLSPPDDDFSRATNYRWDAGKSKGTVSNSLRFSQSTRRLLNEPQFVEEPFRTRYEVALLRTGFMRKSGRTRMTSLVSELCAYFLAGFEDVVLTRLATDPVIVRNWLTELLRLRSAVHPAHAILLEDFLANSDASITTSITTISNSSARPKDEALALAASRHQTLTEAAAELGVSVTTMSTAAKRHGIVKSFRPHAASVEAEPKVIYALTSREEINEIARQFKMSVSAIYRVLRSHPSVAAARKTAIFESLRRDKRAEWTQILSTKPNAKTTELRRLTPAIWAWLYKHDRHWLYKNSPAKNQRTKSRPICAINSEPLRESRRLSAIALGMLVRSSGKPRYISKTMVYRVVGLNDQMVYYLRSSTEEDKVAAYGEPRLNFVQRRLEWAANELDEFDRETPWKKWKKSGLRQKTIQSALEMDSGSISLSEER